VADYNDKCYFHDPFAIFVQCHDRNDPLSGNQYVNGIFNNPKRSGLSVLSKQHKGIKIQSGVSQAAASAVAQNGSGSVAHSVHSIHSVHSVRSASSQQKSVPHYQPPKQSQQLQPSQAVQPQKAKHAPPPNLQRREPPSVVAPPHVEQRENQQRSVALQAPQRHDGDPNQQANGGQMNGDHGMNGSSGSVDNAEAKEPEMGLVGYEHDFCGFMEKCASSMVEAAKLKDKELESKDRELARHRAEIRELKLRLSKYEQRFGAVF